MDACGIRQWAQALDAALQEYAVRATPDDDMQLWAAAHVAAEIFLPCCCMLCNKQKLAGIFAGTRLCAGDERLAQRLAALTYNILARYNGLG